MESYIFLFFWILFQRFSLPVVAANSQPVFEYVMNSNAPMELEAASMKILSFDLLENWVDVTVEYYHNGSVSSVQWYGIGFGNTVMDCTYAIIFEPQLDSSKSTITDVIVTERQLGNFKAGRQLLRRLAHVETTIMDGPTIVIRTRFIRERVLPIGVMITLNETKQCPNNPSGYYQFPFNGSNVDIIFAQGTSGSYNLSLHNPTNSGSGFIQLKAVTSANGLHNTTNAVIQSCPRMNALRNYTYAQRFGAPFVPRVCGNCHNNSYYNVTSPVTTKIHSSNSFAISESFNETENFECELMIGNASNSNGPACGCTNIQWKNVSIVFLVDGSGYQNSTEWYSLTWKILEGFLVDVMLLENSTLLNMNATMDRAMKGMDVNVIVYGGLNRQLQVQKLDWTFLQSIKADPVPWDERFFSNLCNATIFASNYLMKNSSTTSKILVTIPWENPSDDVDCLTCTNCSLNGIHSFTAKIFDQTDLSLVEKTFGAYSSCTYLFENQTEARTSREPWPTVLAAISDFICYSSKIPSVSPGVNFSLELMFTSTLNANALYNFSVNISEIIEEAFEIVSNYTFMEYRDFTVKIKSFNNSIVGPKPPSKPFGKPLHTVMINTVVMCRDIFIEDMLEIFAREIAFGSYINKSCYALFKQYDVSVVVYSVNNKLLNFTLFNESQFNSTKITIINSTKITIETTPIKIQPTSVISINGTIIPSYNTTYVLTPQRHTTSSVWHKIRHFFNHLAVWMIIVIAVGGCIACSLLICICGLCIRCCCMSEDTVYSNSECNNYNEDAPMIVTNNTSTYRTSQQTAQYGGNQYNKSSVTDDDQVYV
jgi:hypothetical protein